MTTCPEPGVLVEEEIDRVKTQIRESPNLLGLMRGLLGQVETIVLATCAVPSFFDIDDAVGDQLTIIGKRLGFPRCHCVCTVPPIFGFNCGGAYNGPYTMAGFCEPGTWAACRDTGVSDICINDDEAYRAILKARRFQALGMFDYDSLRTAARLIWGDTVSVSNLGGGRVVVAPGRALTGYEELIKPLAFRALPVAPGIKLMTSEATGRIAGFGTGWFGFCQGASWLCPVDPYLYSCP